MKNSRNTEVIEKYFKAFGKGNMEDVFTDFSIQHVLL